jgi:hypothetical protein
LKGNGFYFLKKHTYFKSEAKPKQKKMRLIVDSGSTKADWINR